MRARVVEPRLLARAWSRVASGTLALALAGAVLLPGTATADRGPGHPQPGRGVALGDSYASGEGLSPYEPGTDTALNRCHRSPRAYPELLDAGRRPVLRSVRSVACSGAKTSALVRSQTGTALPPQLAALSRRTRTVTLTIGGNDLGFAPVLVQCIYPKVPTPAVRAVVPGQPNCQDRLDLQVRTATARLAGRPGAPPVPDIVPLPQVLRAIHARAPRARIYLTGYPRLFGLTFPEQDGCQVGQLGNVPLLVTGDDVRWIRSKADALNAVIKRSAEQARTQGIRASYVDVATPFTGHNVCSSGTRWVNGLLLTDTNPPTISPASFHPTARGQRAYAVAVAAVVRSGQRGR
jgi:lysophospholipase L1-like esterase